MSPELIPGSEIDLEIEGVGAAGEGIGHAEGRAVFVPFAAPGEAVRARVVHAGRRRVSAELMEVSRASPHRVPPPCPVFGRCGGCQLMHLDYPAQLDFKRRVLEDALRSVTGLSWPGPLPVEPARPALGARNRGQYPVAMRGRQVVSGFFAPRSHRVVAQERCLIHHPDLDAAVGLVRRWAGRKRIPIYDETRGRGWLRHVVVRRSAASGEILLTLVATSDRRTASGDLLRSLRRQLPQVTGLCLSINPDVTNVILGRRTETIWGRERVDERVAGLTFSLSVGSFFQVNTAQAERLFDKVRSYCAPGPRLIVDAYCGVGVLAQILASAGHRLEAIEMVPQAVSDGRRSAEQNGVSVNYHRGRVERVLPELVAGGLRPDAVVLDPPRKGCDPAVLAAVVESGCPRIAYVSCHPGTLARDLKALLAAGYELDRLEAVDMFPQTAHLETFAGLRRAGTS